MIPVTFLEEAQAEVDAEHAYYQARRDGKGDEFVDEVVHIVDLLARFPEAGAPYRISPFRVRPMKVFPFTIVYVFWESVIWIVAVADQRCEPDYWINRWK